MIELALVRSLMQREFYDNHKGSRCPDKLFSKDARITRNPDPTLGWVLKVP